MSENKFENQVQHLMDELKFTPSEEVWPAIKNRIRQKRRRRFFFFLIPVVAGLLFTGYYFLTKTNNLPVSQNEADTPAQKIEQTNTGNGNLPANNSHDKNLNAIQPYKPGLTPAYNDTEQPKTNQHSELVNKDAVPNDFPLSKQNQAEEFETTGGIIDPIIQHKQNDFAGERKITASETFIEMDENIIRSSPVEILPKSIFNISDQNPRKRVTDSVILLTDTAKVLLVEKDQRSKWAWGIHVAAGVSRSGSKTLPGFTPALMDYNSSPNAGGPLFAMPSKLSQNGKSIEAGFILKRQLTPRSSLASGLQYFYASDRIMAGSRYDSTIRVQNSNTNSLSFNNTINRFYRGNDQWYKNQYHFIELPLHYQYMLNIKSKVPVQLQAGLIFSQLIATNGLVYDRTLAGIYYEDKSQFNRSMLSLSSGINVQFHHKERLKWSIGPQVRAGITSMRNATYDQNKFLFSAGLGINLFFD